MFVPCLTNAAGSQISANAAIDYSLPYNVETRSFVTIASSNNVSLENDWYQIYNYRTLPSNYQSTSFFVNVYGVDNYGVPYDIWVSVYAGNAPYNGRLLYDSGWRSGGSISDDNFTVPEGLGFLRVYLRFRYNDSSNNPPDLTYLNNVTMNLSYNVLTQITDTSTTAIPNGWTVDTTVSQSTYATYPTVTTTISPDDVGNLVDSYSPINLVWFTEQLGIFGIVTGWIVSDLPWVLVLICWFLICSIIYWLLK